MDEWRLKRKGKDITLKEVAKVIEVTLDFVSKVERKKRNFTTQDFKKYKEYIENKKI